MDGHGDAPRRRPRRASTNWPVSFRGIAWLELRDGRIVRGWDSWNLGGLISSLTSVGA